MLSTLSLLRLRRQYEMRGCATVPFDQQQKSFDEPPIFHLWSGGNAAGWFSRRGAVITWPHPLHIYIQLYFRFPFHVFPFFLLRSLWPLYILLLYKIITKRWTGRRRREGKRWRFNRKSVDFDDDVIELNLKKKGGDIKKWTLRFNSGACV